MGKKRVGSVIITRKGKLAGIFTERDLLNAFLTRREALEGDIASLISAPLITERPGISVHKAATIMAIKQIRRLPIVSEDKLLGIITARDLVEAYAK